MISSWISKCQTYGELAIQHELEGSPPEQDWFEQRHTYASKCLQYAQRIMTHPSAHPTSQLYLLIFRVLNGYQHKLQLLVYAIGKCTKEVLKLRKTLKKHLAQWPSTGDIAECECGFKALSEYPDDLDEDEAQKILEVFSAVPLLHTFQRYQVLWISRTYDSLAEKMKPRAMKKLVDLKGSLVSQLADKVISSVGEFQLVVHNEGVELMRVGVASSILRERSEYFNAIFSSKMSEIEKREINIEYPRAEPVRVMLDHLYQPRMELSINDTELAFEVFDIAERFGVASLKQAAESYIASGLDDLQLDIEVITFLYERNPNVTLSRPLASAIYAELESPSCEFLIADLPNGFFQHLDVAKIRSFAVSATPHMLSSFVPRLLNFRAISDSVLMRIAQRCFPAKKIQNAIYFLAHVRLFDSASLLGNILYCPQTEEVLNSLHPDVAFDCSRLEHVVRSYAQPLSGNVIRSLQRFGFRDPKMLFDAFKLQDDALAVSLIEQIAPAQLTQNILIDNEHTNSLYECCRYGNANLLMQLLSRCRDLKIFSFVRGSASFTDIVGSKSAVDRDARCDSCGITAGHLTTCQFFRLGAAPLAEQSEETRVNLLMDRLQDIRVKRSLATEICFRQNHAQATDLLQVLVEFHPSLLYEKEEYSPLQIAAFRGNEDACVYLLELGGDRLLKTRRDGSGLLDFPPLMFALHTGHLHLLEILKEEKKGTNALALSKLPLLGDRYSAEKLRLIESELIPHRKKKRGTALTPPRASPLRRSLSDTRLNDSKRPSAGSQRRNPTFVFNLAKRSGIFRRETNRVVIERGTTLDCYWLMIGNAPRVRLLSIDIEKTVVFHVLSEAGHKSIVFDKPKDSDLLCLKTIKNRIKR